ncbi:MAG: phosphatase PAP2 family protein [candidate division KSB1 bacterium]|nr:phosphatase PAP2 family protein [candidate division KSB1 bacterium]MDQ7065311.1 phosphatase PAP2 family protein [candidate division KSB1 bacterium]
MKPMQKYYDQIRTQLSLYEKSVLTYLGISAAFALMFHQNIEKWDYIVGYHFALITSILAINAIRIDEKGWLRFLKNWYIFLVFPVLFKELTFLSQALFPYYLEPLIVSSEERLFGLFAKYLFQPENKWLTELMAFSYSFYYFLVPLVGIYIYRKRSFSEFEIFAFRFCTTMFICYGLFVLIPVRGPHHSVLAADPNALEGYFFLKLIHWMQSYGSAVGAAFPSSHVAATWIAAFSLKRVRPEWYRLALPFLILLTISVFYLRYHYIVDAIAGYALALVLDRYFERKLQPHAEMVIKPALPKATSGVKP